MSVWDWTGRASLPGFTGTPFPDQRNFAGSGPSGPRPGAPDVEAYLNQFRSRPSASTSAPQTAAPTAPTTPAPVTQSYTGDNGFNQYLRNNAGAADAWAYLESLLSTYGLGSLNNWARDNIVQGRSQNEVIQRLRETNEYKTRFRAIVDRQKRGLAPISEAEQVSLERAYAQNRRAAGLPAGFYDSPDDFYENIVNDVSAAEDQSRIMEGYIRYQQSAPETKAEFQRLGFGAGDQVAYWLDPGKAEPILRQRLAAAQVSGAAARSGYGGLSVAEAETLVNSGMTESQAESAFSELAQQSPLFNALPGENKEADINRDSQFSAVRGNANARRRIEQRRQSRLANFGGGGGYGTSQEGFSGVSSTDQ